MALCDFERKWWHARLEIQNQSGSQTSLHTTKNDANAFDIADPKIIVRINNANCTTINNPPAAWSPNQSPGWFIFRPNVQDLGTNNGSIVNVSTFDDVINTSNKRIFKYNLLAAYDSDDNQDCTTNGPPDTHCPEAINTITDDANGIVFQFAQTDFLDEIGCCDIDITPPNPPGDGPGNIRECFRLWFIVEGDGADALPHLYSWDLELDSSIALVDRGEISDFISSLSSQRTYHDVAWDDRNFLWGLEQNGLKRIFIGSSNQNAFTSDYAQITTLNTSIFPIESSLGLAGMSYNQNNQKLYIYANNRFYELEYTGEQSWNVTKETPSELGSTDIGDIAFDPFGDAFIIYDDNLATINFRDDSPNFGLSEFVQNNNNFANIRGMDFALDLGGGDFATLYGVNAAGQIFIIDKQDATSNMIPNANIGEIAVGMSSCQAGEDLTVPPVPFDTGKMPWAFWIDTSNSMNNTGIGDVRRIDLVKSGIREFILAEVEDGDTIWLGKFDSTFEVIQTSTRQEALDWIDTLSVDTQDGVAGFCNAVYPTLWDGTYGSNTLTSAILITDGGLSDCDGNFPTPPDGQGQPQTFEDYIQRGFNLGQQQHNTPQFSIRSVIVNSNDDVNDLRTIGETGMGGFFEWIG